jgi:predicted N-acetyltransferase YhbS
MSDAQWEKTSLIAMDRLRFLLREGKSVVVDDTFSHRFLRERCKQVADECQSGFLIVFVDTPLSTIQERRVANSVTPTRSYIRDDVFEHHCARFQFPDVSEQYVTISTDVDLENWIARQKAKQRSDTTDITMRAAGHADHASTRKLVAEAFGPEGVESFVDALRGEGCLLGEWLAEDDGGPVGFVAFSRVHVEQPNGNRVDAAMLTPLAVRPDRQRSGVGTRLMRHALHELERRGETVFFVLGHPDYYPRAGFRASAATLVTAPWSGNPAFMARGATVPAGRLVLPPAIANAH